MSNQSTETALAPAEPTAVACAPSAANVAAVGAMARRLGFKGETFDDMAKSWLRDVIETKDSGSALQGNALACAVVNFLGGMLAGERTVDALQAAGLDWNVMVALMDISSDFEKVLLDAYRIRRKANALRKDSMGEDVLSTAFQLATVGEMQHSTLTGQSLGFRKKSEKMLDRLLVLAGKEFSKDAAPGYAAGAPEKPSVSLTFNFGGGQTNMGVVDVKEN